MHDSVLVAKAYEEGTIPDDSWVVTFEICCKYIQYVYERKAEPHIS